MSKSNQIRLSLKKTVYCNTRALDKVRHLVVRMSGSLLVPKRGCQRELESILSMHAVTHPKDFSGPSIEKLLGGLS